MGLGLRTRPMSPVDALWLRMDRPVNLMVIDSLLWTEDELDPGRLLNLLQHRIVGRFPVFHEHPVDLGDPLTPPYWEDVPDFDARDRLVEAELDEPGDDEALQRYIEARMPVPFDRSKPLWEVHLLHGYHGGSAVYFRFHHAMADGIALAQVMLSMTDEEPDGDLVDRHPVAVLPATGHRRGSGRSPLHLLGDGARLAAKAPQLLDPRRALDLMSTAVKASEVGSKFLLASLPPTALHGEVGVEKRAVWSQGIALDSIKTVARSFGGTVNDVMMAAVSGSIRAYLDDRGVPTPDLGTMVPVNIRPLDRPLPAELGNAFALVIFSMPISPDDPVARLEETKQRMDHIKASPEAALAFGIISAVGRTTPELERWVVDFFTSKAIGVTTNVPGPREGRYLAGAPVVGALGWAPGSGQQSLMVCVFSYDGSIRVGFKADRTLIPDAERLVQAFDQEIAELRRLAAAVA